MSADELVTSDLVIGGFREWLPLQPTWPDEEYVDYVVDHFADEPAGADTIRAMAQRLAALGHQNAERGDDGLTVVSAWVLLPPGGRRLVLRSLATLTGVRVPVGADDSIVIDMLIEGAELYQPVHLERLETRSGPAQVVRFRTFAEVDGRTKITETPVVYWLRPDNGIVVMLSALPTDDLVLAADVADAMLSLAESVQGL